MKNLLKASLWLLLTGVMMFAAVSCDNTKSDNKVSVYSYGGEGFIDKTGELVIEPIFDDSRNFFEGLARVKVGDKWGFIDKTGKIVIEPSYYDARSFSEGLAGVRIGKKWGFIDKLGNVVIEPTFDDVRSFSEGLAGAKTGQWGFIDKSGNIIIKPSFDDILDFSQGLARVGKFIGLDGYKKLYKYGFVDKAGNMVVKQEFDDAGSFTDDGLACVLIDGRRGFIDKTGSFAFDQTFDNAKDFSEGLAGVRIGEKWGFIDKNGAFVIDPVYGYVEKFSEGLAEVQIGDQFDDPRGFIDKNGNVVIEAKYDWAFDFKDGLAKVGVYDAFSGFIDKSGNMVDKEGFSSNDYFSEGLCSVEVPYRYGLQTVDGAAITDPIYKYLEICPNELVLAEKEYGEWGIIDQKGNTVLDFVYHRISYSRGKFYLENEEYEIGVADNNGKVVVEPKYGTLAELYEFELIDDDDDYHSLYHSLWRNKEGVSIEEDGHLGISMTFTNVQGDTLVLATMYQQGCEWNAVRYLYNEDGSLRGFLSGGYGLPYCYDYSTYDSRAIDYGDYGYRSIMINDDFLFDLAFDLDENKPYYVRFYFERDEEGRIIRVYDPILHFAIHAPYDGHFEYVVKPEAGFGVSDIDYGNIDMLFITAPNDPCYQHFKVDTFNYYLPQTEPWY